MPIIIDDRPPDNIGICEKLWANRDIKICRFYDRDRNYANVYRIIKGVPCCYFFTKTVCKELGYISFLSKNNITFSTTFGEGEDFEFIKDIMSDLEKAVGERVRIRIRD